MAEITNSFEKELSLHGYGFQYAVIRKAREAVDSGSRWMFKVSEFPVEVRGAGTKIDFILAKRREGWRTQVFLICECKRANPASANWCFVAAPFIRRNKVSQQVILDSADIVDELMPDVRVFSRKGSLLDKAYHIGLEVRTNEKGDS